MKISIGSDHAGRKLKLELVNYLVNKGYIIYDCGTYTDISVDYPDYAKKACQKLLERETDYAILVCFTGIGMSMVANKYKGIRAALVSKVEDAILTKEHNNSNVLCLSAKNTSVEVAIEITEAFLNTNFTFGRHERRVNKIKDIENEQFK